MIIYFRQNQLCKRLLGFYFLINIIFFSFSNAVTEHELESVVFQSPNLLLNLEEYNLLNAEYEKEFRFQNPELKYEKMNIDDENPVWTFTQKIPSLLEWYFLDASYNSKNKSQEIKNKLARNFEINNINQIQYELLLLNKRKELLTEQQKIFDQLISNFKNQYVLEKMSQTELLNIQIAKIEKSEELLNLESEIETKKNELNIIIGESDINLYQIAVPAIFFTEDKLNFILNDEPQLHRLIESSYQVQIIREKSIAEKEFVSSQKAKFFPEFELMYFKKGNENGYGISLELPLWGAGDFRSDIQIARSKQIITDHEVELTRRETKAAIKNALFKYIQIIKKKKFFESGLLALSQQSYVSSLSNYKTGKIRYTDLLNSLNGFFESQFKYEETKIDLAKLSSELKLKYNIVQY